MNPFLKFTNCLFFCLLFFSGLAQQTALSNFYQYNWQLQNPAAFDRIYMFDKHKTMMFNATYRNQWAWSTIEGAPVNYSLSFEHIPTRNKCNKCNRVKWGFNAYQDETHAISNTGVYTNFSYYFPLSNQKNKWLHFGISPGLVRYGVDLSKVTFKDQKDIATINDDQLYADFSFGIFYRHQKKFYMGLSVPQTFSLAVASTNKSAPPNNNKLAKERVQHLYFVIGGFINSAKDRRSDNNITIEPSAWLRYVPGITFNTWNTKIPVSGDLSIRAYYNNGGTSGKPLFWVGTGYGTNRNLKLEVGATSSIFNAASMSDSSPDRVRFGISWDLPIGTRSINLGQSLELNIVYAWDY